MPDKERLKQYLVTISNDLDKCVSFWLQYSHDTEYGGFFNCLGEKGEVYDHTKYCWLQGRQVWMYARLYTEVERFHKPEILSAAIEGGTFLMKHAKNPNTWKCYFSLTRDGQPIKTQRTIFSECFYTMAMSELFRATGNQLYKEEALKMFDNIIGWARDDPTPLGRPSLSGCVPVNSLAAPMMILCLVEELLTMDPLLEKELGNTMAWCKDRIIAHVQRGGTVVLENVADDGHELSGTNGRLINPGHVLEGGWFLLQLAARINDQALEEMAIDIFIMRAFDQGWDRDHGGLLYFMDVDGWSSTQLEWHMKLWWPHCEALIALLMAYTRRPKEELINKFDQVFSYCYENFADAVNGEWFGYLDREGQKTATYKGGPFKGCFHVPRCLMMCENLLKKLLIK